MAYFNNVPESGIVGTTGHCDIADPWIYAGSPEQTADLKKFQAEADAADKAFEPIDKDKTAQARWAATKDPKALPTDAGKLHALYLDQGLTLEARAIRDGYVATHKELNDLRDALPRVMV